MTPMSRLCQLYCVLVSIVLFRNRYCIITSAYGQSQPLNSIIVVTINGCDLLLFADYYVARREEL
jgi:hypothetical protein